MIGTLLALLAAGPAAAATLRAGPGTAYPQPSAAIAAATPGDTVVVAPGTYYDCAAWNTDRLTIEGVGATEGVGVVLSDQACADKAAFVIGGTGTVVRGITFTHLRVTDGNGAGIRLEGGSLLVEDCTFDDDQAAVIASGGPGAALVLRRVTVRQVGVPGGTRPAVSAEAIASLRIEDSRFLDPRGGGGAVRTSVPSAIVGSAFEYGTADTPVIEAAGPLTVDATRFHLTGARPAAIRAMGPGVVVRGTSLSHTGTGALLLQDWTGGNPVLAGNIVASADTEASSAGAALHRAKDAAHATYSLVRHLAGRVRHLLP